MSAFNLPKATDEEKKIRTQTIQDATKFAIEIPFKVMRLSYESLELIKAMAEQGLAFTKRELIVAEHLQIAGAVKAGGGAVAFPHRGGIPG